MTCCERRVNPPTRCFLAATDRQQRFVRGQSALFWSRQISMSFMQRGQRTECDPTRLSGLVGSESQRRGLASGEPGKPGGWWGPRLV
jgi:hypothetical protein